MRAPLRLKLANGRCEEEGRAAGLRPWRGGSAGREGGSGAMLVLAPPQPCPLLAQSWEPPLQAAPQPEPCRDSGALSPLSITFSSHDPLRPCRDSRVPIATCPQRCASVRRALSAQRGPCFLSPHARRACYSRQLCGDRACHRRPDPVRLSRQRGGVALFACKHLQGPVATEGPSRPCHDRSLPPVPQAAPSQHCGLWAWRGQGFAGVVLRAPKANGCQAPCCATRS